MDVLIAAFLGLSALGRFANQALDSLLAAALREEEQSKAARGGRGPVPQWQQQIEAVSQLPRSHQQLVARMIEAVFAQAATR